MLTISSTIGYKGVVDGQEISFLEVELVDITEIKDLEIDWIDTKVYQLMNNTNKAKYYYNQVKYQCFGLFRENKDT